MAAAKKTTTKKATSAKPKVAAKTAPKPKAVAKTKTVKTVVNNLSVVEILLIGVILALITGIITYVGIVNNRVIDTYDQANDTSSAIITPAETDLLTTAVKNYKDNVGDTALKVTIDHANSSFALGGVDSPQGDAGGEWFAQKVNGTWQVQSQGADGHCEELAAVQLTSWETSCTENN